MREVIVPAAISALLRTTDLVASASASATPPSSVGSTPAASSLGVTGSLIGWSGRSGGILGV